MTNPVAEIIARQCCFQFQSAECALGRKGEPGCFDKGSNCRHWREYLDWAHAIIAALEGAGWKILAREPTEKMVDGASYHVQVIHPDDSSYSIAVAALIDAWDAAPSWARNKREAGPRNEEPRRRMTGAGLLSPDP